jgi:hypothetical protein
MEHGIVGGADRPSPQRRASGAFTGHLVGQVEETGHHRGHGSLQFLIGKFILIVRECTTENHEAILTSFNEFGSDLMKGIDQLRGRHVSPFEMSLNPKNGTSVEVLFRLDG